MDSFTEEAIPALAGTVYCPPSPLPSAMWLATNWQLKVPRCQCALSSLFLQARLGVWTFPARADRVPCRTCSISTGSPTNPSDSRPIFLCRALLKVVSRAESVLIHRPSEVAPQQQSAARGATQPTVRFVCIHKLPGSSRQRP